MNTKLFFILFTNINTHGAYTENNSVGVSTPNHNVGSEEGHSIPYLQCLRSVSCLFPIATFNLILLFQLEIITM